MAFHAICELIRKSRRFQNHLLNLSWSYVARLDTSEMPLIYAFVSRGTTVLADYTTYTGEHMSLLRFLYDLFTSVKHAFAVQGNF